MFWSLETPGGFISLIIANFVGQNVKPNQHSPHPELPPVPATNPASPSFPFNSSLFTTLPSKFHAHSTNKAPIIAYSAYSFSCVFVFNNSNISFAFSNLDFGIESKTLLGICLFSRAFIIPSSILCGKLNSPN